MHNKHSFSLVAVLFSSVLLANEPSAFEAGNLNSPNPYGLTSSEKRVLQTTKSLNEDVVEVKSTIGTVNEQLEGIRSVIGSYNDKIAKMDARMAQLEDENLKLKAYVEESRKIQEENQESVKKVLAELASLIDSINKNYVTKEQFNRMTSAQSKASPEKSAPAEKSTPSKALSSKESITLLSEADTLFEAKQYAKAKELYSELLTRNYKPAKVNFVLGEIAHAQKSYSTAIEHYKTSITLYDKASYIPTLLYHTGLSLDKLGKAQEAKGFYKALKEGYPDSAEAKKVK